MIAKGETLLPPLVGQDLIAPNVVEQFAFTENLSVEFAAIWISSFPQLNFDLGDKTEEADIVTATLDSQPLLIATGGPKSEIKRQETLPIASILTYPKILLLQVWGRYFLDMIPVRPSLGSFLATGFSVKYLEVAHRLVLIDASVSVNGKSELVVLGCNVASLCCIGLDSGHDQNVLTLELHVVAVAATDCCDFGLYKFDYDRSLFSGFISKGPQETLFAQEPYDDQFRRKPLETTSPVVPRSYLKRAHEVTFQTCILIVKFSPYIDAEEEAKQGFRIDSKDAPCMLIKILHMPISSMHDALEELNPTISNDLKSKLHEMLNLASSSPKKLFGVNLVGHF
ncbi:hypothetical protein HAX54_030165 [Datura stramonium]|uniref:Uncharacterized protein n=1 Tax=Datura stramonium TaxID=4076 RepID=A0ABS8VA49_DATST|nr:hypothetical protein [Datura stramonium]